MNNATRLKPPREVCHALDCRFVFAGEGHACQFAALGERPVPDARHAVGDRHARKIVATLKRPIPYARHAVGDRHARQPAATFERPVLDGCRADRNDKVGQIVERKTTLGSRQACLAHVVAAGKQASTPTPA